MNSILQQVRTIQITYKLTGQIQRRKGDNMSVAEILEAADTLTLPEQELIAEVLQKRIIEKRRQLLITDIEEARNEYQSGKLNPQTAEEILNDLRQ